MQDQLICLTQSTLRSQSNSAYKSTAREYACCEAIRLAEREMHLRRSRQVPRRAKRGALRSKVARGCARTAKRIHRPKVAAERRRSLEWCRKAAPCAAGKRKLLWLFTKEIQAKYHVSRYSYIPEKGDVFFQ